MKTTSLPAVGTVALLATLALLPRPAAAGDAKTVEPPVTVEEPAREPVVLTLRGTYVFESDFKDAEFGSQDALNSGARITHLMHVGEKLDLTLGFDYRRFDFGSSAAPVPTTMQGISVPITLSYLIQGKPAIRLTTAPGFNYADSFEADGFDAPTLLTFAFKPTKSVVVVVGALYSRLREYPVLPVAGVIWDISDKLTLNGLLPAPELVYKPNPDTEIGLGAELTAITVLNDDSIPGYENEYLTYWEIRAGTGIKYNGLKPLAISLNAGWAFLRRFDYADLDQTIDVEGAPYVQIQATVDF